MNTKNKIFFSLLIPFLLVYISVFLNSCAKSEFSDYEETASGLKYKFHTKSNDTVHANYGEIVRLKLIKRLGDSVLENSQLINPDGLEQMLRKGAFAGAIEEGIVMMSLGDSATFLINTDSINKYYPAKDSAENFTPHSYLTFDLKLMNIQTQEEAMWVREQNRKVFIEERKEKEPKEMARYIEDNHIDVQPTKSGMYFMTKEKGSGIKPLNGDSVIIHYVGSFLNGTIFDSSVKRNEPFGFVIKTIGDHSVIPGWVEAIKMMNKGQVATIIMPSSLAYDSSGYINPQNGKYFINPYCPMKFDIQLLEIVKKK